MSSAPTRLFCSWSVFSHSEGERKVRRATQTSHLYNTPPEYALDAADYTAVAFQPNLSAADQSVLVQPLPLAPYNSALADSMNAAQVERRQITTAAELHILFSLPRLSQLLAQLALGRHGSFTTTLSFCVSLLLSTTHSSFE